MLTPLRLGYQTNLTHATALVGIRDGYFQRGLGKTELGRVPDLARSLLGDPDRLTEMGAAMKRVALPDAADEIAEELIALAR